MTSYKQAAPTRFIVQAGIALICVCLWLYAKNEKEAPLLTDNNAFIELCAEAKPGAIQAALNRGARADAVWEGSEQMLKGHPFIYEGESALQVAVRENPHLESIQLLLDAGADPNLPSGGPLMGAVERNKADYVALLLERGALATHEYNGWSILLSAASKDPDIVEMLLKAGANVHAATGSGQTALHMAVMSDSAEAVRLLVEAGADPNATDKRGNVPLHTLVHSPLIIETLAKAGADVNLENKNGLTALEINDHPQVSPYDDTKADPAIIEAFLAAGAQIFKRNAAGNLVARGFSEGGTGYAQTRFFAADGLDAFPASRIEESSPLKKKIFATVALETSRQAAEADAGSKYALEILWSYDNSDEPAANVSYYLASAGAVIYGTSGPDGRSVEFQTPAREAVRGNVYEEAKKTVLDILSSEKKQLYGEKICFIQPEKRLPVSAYPYYVISGDAYAMSGKTGKDGCTAEMFTQSRNPFIVYGGENALRVIDDLLILDVNDSWNFDEATP